jgi:hypothetical protein
VIFWLPIQRGHKVIFCSCRKSPQWTKNVSFMTFLYHTQRHITVCRTSLDELSARSRDLYLTTHNTHDKHTSMPLVGFEPTISASQRPQNYALNRAVTVTGKVLLLLQKCEESLIPLSSAAYLTLTAIDTKKLHNRTTDCGHRLDTWKSKNNLILTVTSHGHQYGLIITEAVLIQFCLSWRWAHSARNM